MLNDRMQRLLDLLAKSEKNSLQENLTKQIQAFEKLYNHAYASVPFYKKYYTSAKLVNVLDLPILTRADIQYAGNDFISTDLPYFHGDCYPMETSGSTGRPITILGTDFTRIFYDALMLRENAWQQRDLNQTLLAIKWAQQDFARAPNYHEQPTWGPPIDKYQKTGNSFFVNIIGKNSDHINILLQLQPKYLHTYPSHAAALAEYCLNNKIQLNSLRELKFTGETLSEKQIDTIKMAWPSSKITDIYSSVEFGYIAQQCPEQGNYHVNIENVYVEILDENNQPCLNKTGKVIITSLMNYATPLIRYEIGDYAAWGEPCACGRNLPVIKKIYGRQRNRLRMPDGESRFPYLGDRDEIASVGNNILTKFQFIQHSLHEIELKVVVNPRYTAEQEAQFVKIHQRNFGYPFNIRITYHDDIPSGPQGKFEEFISLVS